MSLVSFPRTVRAGRPTRTGDTIFRPTMERLEDRSVPANLLTTAANGTDLPDAPVTVLATSEDGNFVLAQSTATNLVPGQIDVPGTNDLFWFDLTSGTRKLVTAFDPTNRSTILPGTKALGAELSSPGNFLNAVLSGDGKTVAFLSGANAQQFNAGLPAATDDGGDDVYSWNSQTGTVTLISKDKNGFALGGFAAVSNPAIDRDGRTVAFVSTVVMYDHYDNKYKAGEDQGVIDPGPFGPNLFSAVDGGTPHPVTYFFSNVNSLTGKQGTFYVPFSDIVVDPLGRYISAEGLSFAVISDNRNSTIFGGTAGTTVGSDVYRFSYAGVGLNPGGTLNFSLITFSTVTDPFFGTITEALGSSGLGTAGNAIISGDRGDVILYSAKMTGGAIVPGYKNQNGGGFDLYRAAFTGGAQTVNGATLDFVSVLITAQAGSTTAGGDGTLDLTPGGFQISPDGRHVLFTSTGSNYVSGLIDTNKSFDVFSRDVQTGTTSAISVTAANPNRTGLGESRFPVQTTDGLIVAYQSTAADLTSIPDTNGTTDVFVRDLVRKTTAAASVVPGHFSTGNDKSFGPVIGGGFQSGQLFFDSDATDLDRAFQPTQGVDQIYSVQTPILVTNLSRTVGYSGGSGGFVAISHLDLDGNLITDNKFQPFPGFTGELRVATGDVNGDGVPDLVVGAGPGGGPAVIVIDGFNGRTLRTFFAYESSFTGGVYVGVADLNGDGFGDVIVGAGEGGGPRVRVFSGANGAQMLDQFAYEAEARTGVRVAGGDFNGDGRADLLVSAGIGGGPRVRVFDGTALPNLSVLADFFAFESGQRGGAYIAAGDYNLDGKADIAVGAGPDGGPRVRVFNAANVVLQDPNQPLTFVDFFADDPDSRNGVRVALRDIDGDQIGDLVTGSGGGLPMIKTYVGGLTSAPQTPLLKQQIIPFDDLSGQFGAWVG